MKAHTDIGITFIISHTRLDSTAASSASDTPQESREKVTDIAGSHFRSVVGGCKDGWMDGKPNDDDGDDNGLENRQNR